MSALTESDVVAACDERARAFGYAVEVYSDARRVRTAPGLPDRRYVHPRGVRVWCEAKKPGGKLTREQHAFLTAELAANAHAIAVDDVAQLHRLLQDLARDAGRGAALDYCRQTVALIAARGYRGERKAAA